MTKKILLTAMVVAFTFSGCSQLSNSKLATDKVAEATKKANDGADKAKKATSKAVKVTETVEPSLPESSMKDQVVEEVVEVVDAKTDGAATKVIESVK